jgi:wyosine [tRNA(Phe)-imidazoG37] synthetase (radical SAM superfamily)
MTIDIHWTRLVPEKKTIAFPSKIVYGPIISKRSFHSLGINFWPKKKVCTFNCRYCHCGKSSLDTENNINFEEMIHEIEKAFEFHAKNNPFIQDIVVEGNGEPTIYPYFYQITTKLMELRDKYFQNLPLVLYTNSTNLQNKKVREAIINYDQVFFKLDGAEDKIIQRLDEAKKPIIQIIKEIFEIGQIIKTRNHRLKNFDISTAVVGSEIGNYDSLNSEKFTQIIKILSPDRIYLYDIDRFSPGEKYDFRIKEEQIESLAKKICKTTQIETIALFSKKGRGIHELSEINALKATITN